MIGETYDCGPYGHLTQIEIARAACISPEAVRQRIKRGKTGAELVKGPQGDPPRIPIRVHVEPLWRVCEPGPLRARV